MATKKEENKTRAENVYPGEKLVKVKIPRERDGDNAPVHVGVNERDWWIQRGVEVEVPECVAEVLQHRDEMLDIIDEFNSSFNDMN